METITATLDGIRVDEPQVHRNLTVFPLTGSGLEIPDYLTLDEALGKNLVEITEISDGGSVPILNLDNKADVGVLLLDGEELIGAKQNRILNLTVLAPANQKISIPVSCVEAGRWHHVSRHFAASQQIHFAEGRARKAARVSESIHLSKAPRSDQGEVWNDINAKFSRLNAQSPSAEMNAIFEKHKVGIDEYLSAFSHAEGQIGAIYGIDGKIIGMELFDSSVTFRKLQSKILRSYALDAIDTFYLTNSEKRCSVSNAAQFLEDVFRSECITSKAVGEGEDVRLMAEGISGGALAARNRLIHLNAFRLVNDRGSFKNRRPE